MTDTKLLEAAATVMEQMIDEAYGIAPDKHFAALLAQSAIDAYKERECVWTRRGSPATEEWCDSGCGLTEVDINPISDETPLTYCPNCGGKIVEPREV